MVERNRLTEASLFETQGLIQTTGRHRLLLRASQWGCRPRPLLDDDTIDEIDLGAAAPFSNNLTSPFNRDSTGTGAGQIPDFMKSWIVRTARHAMEAVASNHRRLVKRPPDQLLSGAAEKIGQISAE
jgi:hypothetical protein